MNVLIPMMGVGKRFIDAGYNTDKPFININGKMVIENVTEPLLKRYGHINIACRKEQADVLKKVFTAEQLTIYVLNDSKGAGDTIQQVVRHFDDRAVLCVDCDTILNDVALSKISNSGNMIMSFKDNERTGLYSYLTLEQERITAIVEKEAISTIANAGVYLFNSKSVILDNYLENADGEYYLSKIVMNAIKENTFTTTDISNEFDCVGTPFQLQNYCKKLSIKDKVFCFDIDRTLIHDILLQQEPIKSNIDYCNYLYDNGAKIILFTARGMLSYNGNIQQIEDNIVPVIKKLLTDYNINHHELIIGKPYADYYIDDKSINAFKELQKETGVYYALDNEARQHHQLTIQEDIVIKRGDLRNESFYYDTLPDELLNKYFAGVRYVSNKEIILDRVKKSTYSNLLLCGKLTEKHIIDLLQALYNIHTYICNVDKKLDVDWGYNKKPFDRYNNNVELYNKLGISIKDITNLTKIKSDTGCSIIQGDAVFTNVFDGVKFIDPRGNWCDKQSIFGDRHYDYAKVLQSLYGYDYALKDIEIEQKYLFNLRNVFFTWYAGYYPTRSIEELKNYTKLLMLSMLPLHSEDIERCKRFIKIIKSII